MEAFNEMDEPLTVGIADVELLSWFDKCVILSFAWLFKPGKT